MAMSAKINKACLCFFTNSVKLEERLCGFSILLLAGRLLGFFGDLRRFLDMSKWSLTYQVRLVMSTHSALPLRLYSGTSLRVDPEKIEGSNYDIFFLPFFFIYFFSPSFFPPIKLGPPPVPIRYVRAGHIYNICAEFACEENKKITTLFSIYFALLQPLQPDCRFWVQSFSQKGFQVNWSVHRKHGFLASIYAFPRRINLPQ